MSTEQAPAPPSRGAGPSGPRAGFWLRFVAAVIDALLISLVTVPLALSLDPGLYYAIATLIGIAYYAGLEGGRRGQTLGKRACGIRVLGLDDGRPIGLARGLIRYVGRYLSGFAFLIGYLWMLWDSEKQTWHDKLSTSVVVPTDAYPID